MTPKIHSVVRWQNNWVQAFNYDGTIAIEGPYYKVRAEIAALFPEEDWEQAVWRDRRRR